MAKQEKKMIQLLLLLLVVYFFMSKRKGGGQNNNNNPTEPRRSQRVHQQSKKESTGLATQNHEPRYEASIHKKASSAGNKMDRLLDQSDAEFPVLRRLDLYASDTKGDGNCMFRAMGDQLCGDGGKSHAQIRCSVVNYMKEHIEYFAQFIGIDGENWQQYLRRMSRDAVYGDNTEIVAFARCFNANVVIYQRESCYVVTCDHPASAKEVHIAYHEWEHYSSVRNKGGPFTGMPCVKPRETPFAAQQGDSAVAPDYKIKIVQQSMPTPISEQVVRAALVENGGNINNTVDVLLTADIAELSNEPESKKQMTESASPKPKTGKLTAREKKEKQKREALERKREKHVTSSTNNHNNHNGSTVHSPSQLGTSTSNAVKTVYI